jgi:hypothetical protein
MRTQLLGKVELDEPRLLKDLETSTALHYAEPYVEFLCGLPWKSAMLWAPNGEIGDDVIAHYDTSAASGPTPNARQLPYVLELIEKSVNTKLLTFARMVVMSDSVLVPHRDYVELSEAATAVRPAHRLHVSLATSEDCLFTEANEVYRMRRGEVWFLDAARLHSAAVLSDTRRVHLLLDFADVDDGARLLNFEIANPPGVPLTHIAPREPLSDAERAEILGLARIVDLDNLREVIGLVIKKHYRKDGGENFVWHTVTEIGRLSGNPAVLQKIEELHKHYVLERAE